MKIKKLNYKIKKNKFKILLFKSIIYKMRKNYYKMKIININNWCYHNKKI